MTSPRFIVHGDVDDYSINAIAHGVDPSQTDNSTGLFNAITAAAVAGKALRITKPGTYNIVSGVTVNLSNNLAILMEEGVVLKAASTLASKMLHLQTSTSTRLRIEGGTFDVSAIPSDTASSYGELYLPGFDGVSLERMNFYAGADYRTAGGDSSIFCQSNRIKIRDCSFTGAADAAIYISASQLETNGEEAIIEGNRFYGCNNGVIFKRQFLRGIVGHNVFKKCFTGVVTGEADTSLLPGHDNIIANNHFYRTVGRAIDVRWSDSTTVTGNRIEDMGLDLSGSAQASSVGISLSGSNYCAVSGNVLIQRTGPSTSGHIGINLETKAINATSRSSTFNSVADNITDSFNIGIAEMDSDQDFNSLHGNLTPNCGTGLLKSGLSSPLQSQGQVWLVEETTGGRAQIRAQGAAAAVGLAYYAKGTGNHRFVVSSSINNPVGEMVPQDVNPVNYLRLNGRSSGNSPSLQALGADTNLNLPLIPKGTGLVSFGTHTALSGETVTGYIMVADSSGTTRKIAVVS